MDRADDGSRSLTVTVESLCRVVAANDADRDEAKRTLLGALAAGCRAAGATARLPGALVARLEKLLQAGRPLTAAGACESINSIIRHGSHTQAAVQVGTPGMVRELCGAFERLVAYATKHAARGKEDGFGCTLAPLSALVDSPPGALADAAARGGAARLLAAARSVNTLAEGALGAGVVGAPVSHQPDTSACRVVSPLLFLSAALTQLLDHLSALDEPGWAASAGAAAVRAHAPGALAAATRTVRRLVSAAPAGGAFGAADSREQQEVWKPAMTWLAVASKATGRALQALPQSLEVVSAVASALGLLGDLAAAAQAERTQGASGGECAYSLVAQAGHATKACAAVLGLLRPVFDAPNSALAAGASAAVAWQAGAVLRLLAHPDMRPVVPQALSVLSNAVATGGCAHAACALRALRAQRGLYAVLTAAMERVVPGEEDDWAVPLVASLLAAGQPGAEAQLGACLAARPRVWTLLQGSIARLGASPSGLDCSDAAMQQPGSAAMLLAWAAQHATPAQRAALRSEPGLLSAAARALPCTWQVPCRCKRKPSNGRGSGGNGAGSSGSGGSGSGGRGGGGDSGSGGVSGGGSSGDTEDHARACRDPEWCLNAEGVYRQLTHMLLALTGGDEELRQPEPALSAVAGTLVDSLKARANAAAAAAAAWVDDAACVHASGSSSPLAGTLPAPGPGLPLGSYDAQLLARLEAYQAMVRASRGGEEQPGAAPTEHTPPAAHATTQQPSAHQGPLAAGAPSAAVPSEPAAPPAAAPACAGCGQHADAAAGVKLKACAGCRAVRYCGTACQAQHWAAGHKRECRRLAAARRGEGGGEQAGAPAGLGVG